MKSSFLFAILIAGIAACNTPEPATGSAVDTSARTTTSLDSARMGADSVRSGTDTLRTDSLRRDSLRIH